MELKVDTKAGTFTLSGKLEKGKVSASGKSMLLATTKGTKVYEGVQVDGEDVEVNCNITIPNPDFVRTPKGQAPAPAKA